ncbi:DoxX family membrane protein [Streptomyces sp. NPDC026659]|uniref:DoxX family protein n=1 Tax=Streptomyces sp. NPDC026659 TaxID=3155123 RepID=UPI0033D003F9
MSVDTRTPRTPTGDRSSGFDDVPALSMVKVPSDPAQVIVNHASFRVQLGAAARRNQSARIARQLSTAQTSHLSSGSVGTAARAGAGRRRPVVWTGRSAPDDTGAHRLLQAVRGSSVRHPDEPAGATQVIPRVGTTPGDGYDDGYDRLDATVETPVLGHQRTSSDGGPLLPPLRGGGGAYDEPGYDSGEFEAYDDTAAPPGPRVSRRHGDEAARHAYYPGRRLNLGVVLLPLRVFLGFISTYAGMGKLCDPVYFDGGERGSMVKWLNTLHPWDVAEPLRQFALHHPVGSGLVIAFLQVVVGVLTILGCWQRAAAVVGALLSAALIVTVSWKTVPAYDAPDIIYLAAWSPLVIAGAPVYSVDGRLAAGAWRTLGPRAAIWDLRRYVLRRGALITAVTIGLTLLIGAVLGGAVRASSRVVVPGPGEAPRNNLPGSALPQEPSRKHSATPSATGAPTGGATVEASPSAVAPAAGRTAGAATAAPSQTQGTTGQAPPSRTEPSTSGGGGAPSTSAGPTSTGGTATGGTDSAPSGADPATGGTSTGEPGLVGGLFGD